MTIFLTARDPFSNDPTSDAVAHLETGNLPAARMWARNARRAGLAIDTHIVGASATAEKYLLETI